MILASDDPKTEIEIADSIGLYRMTLTLKAGRATNISSAYEGPRLRKLSNSIADVGTDRDGA